MENVIERNDKNEIINNKFNPVNLSDESNNSDNLNHKTYGKDPGDDDFDLIEWIRDPGDDDFDLIEWIRLNQEYGLCPECNQPNTYENWCKECYSKKFQQNFGNWTSENEHIDKFIQEAQLNARVRVELLEWIPYNRLRNIQFLAQGGFSTVYEGIWLDGRVKSWDYEKQQWKRKSYELDEQNFKDANDPKIKNPLKSDEKYGYIVALKSLNDSSNINENFLDEVSNC